MLLRLAKQEWDFLSFIKKNPYKRGCVEIVHPPSGLLPLPVNVPPISHLLVFSFYSVITITPSKNMFCGNEIKRLIFLHEKTGAEISIGGECEPEN